MKNLMTFGLLLFVCSSAISQKFKRTDIIYSKLEKEEYGECTQEDLQKVDKIFSAIESNQSKYALDISNEFKNKFSCPEVIEAVAVANFRSGELLEGIEFLDEGIKKIGASPILILRRSRFSIELFQLGVRQKNIDGNSVFVGEDAGLPYKEEKFKKENLRSAIYDLEYIISTYQFRYEEIFTLAQLYSVNGEFEKSNVVLDSLIDVEEFSTNALYLQAMNYSDLKKDDEAEKRFLQILELHGNNYKLLQEVGKFYKNKGDQKKADEYFGKAEFYYYVPPYLEMSYSKENMSLIKFFSGDQSKEEKNKKLKEIFEQGNSKRTADLCLVILKMHANHGNGLEEYAAELLGEIGKNEVGKIHEMFMSNVSTCTITNLGEAMLKIGDEKSWDLMVKYLPYIADMPMTLTPPSIPEKIIQFKEEEGLIEVLKVVKKIYNKPPSDNPLMSGFGNYVFYAPLRKLDSKKVLEKAKSLGFNEKELEELKKDIKK